MQFISAGGGIKAVPDDLVVTAVVSGLDILLGVAANKFREDVDEAELRMMFIDVTDPLLPYYDLRTVAEGGTFVDNGTTQRIFTGIVADSLGAQQALTSPNPGRWVFAWKLHNMEGDSHWTDGNETPSEVRDYVQTDIDTTVDTAPPDGWEVSLAEGPRANTVVVKVTKPDNATIIRGIAFQIVDGDTVTYRELDDNAGAASTEYDGSAVNHTLSHGGKRLTRTAGAGFGTAALGDMVCCDVRGGAFSIEYCQEAVIVAFEGNNAATATWVEFDTALEPQTLTTLRMKIVTPPWLWGAADGYLGNEANRGYLNTRAPGAAGIGGSKGIPTYQSPPIEIPAAITNPEAMVYITNGYSTSTNSTEHSTGITGGLGVTPPRTWTDFSDESEWVRVAQDPTAVSMVFGSNGQPTFTGLRAHTTNPASLDQFIGIISQGRFFPDPATGNLKLSFTFDNYSSPTDQTAALDYFFLGMGIAAGYADVYNAQEMPFYGFGYNAAIGPVTRRCTIGRFVINGNFSYAYTALSAFVDTAVTTFTIQLEFGPRTKGAGTSRSWGLTRILTSGDGAWTADDIANPGGDTQDGAWLGKAGQVGFSIMLGCWPGDNSNQAAARLTNFTLLEGKVVNSSGAGIVLAQNCCQPVAESPRSNVEIYHITRAK